MTWLMMGFVLSLIILSVLQGTNSQDCNAYHNSGIPGGCEPISVASGNVCYRLVKRGLFEKNYWEAEITCFIGFEIHGPSTRRCTWYGSFWDKTWSWDEHFTKCMLKPTTQIPSTQKSSTTSTSAVSTTRNITNPFNPVTEAATTAKDSSTSEITAGITSEISPSSRKVTSLKPNLVTTVSTTKEAQSTALPNTSTTLRVIDVTTTSYAADIHVLTQEINHGLNQDGEKEHRSPIVAYIVIPLAALIILGGAFVLLFMYRRRKREENSSPSAQKQSELTVNNMAYDRTGDTPIPILAVANVENTAKATYNGNIDNQLYASEDYSTIDNQEQTLWCNNTSSQQHGATGTIPVTREDYHAQNGNNVYSNLLGGSTGFKSHSCLDISAENAYDHLGEDHKQEEVSYSSNKKQKANVISDSIYNRLEAAGDNDDIYDHAQSSNNKSGNDCFKNEKQNLNCCGHIQTLGADAYYDHAGVGKEVRGTDNVYNQLNLKGEHIRKTDLISDTHDTYTNPLCENLAEIELNTYDRVGRNSQNR